MAISEGEFSEQVFCKEIGSYERYDHQGSEYPSAMIMRTQSKEKQIEAFRDYCRACALYDVKIISEQLSKEEIERNINTENYKLRDEFIEIITFLVRNKSIDINKSDPYSGSFLSNSCSSITIKHLIELERLGLKLTTVDYQGNNILYYLDPNSKDYLEVVEYLSKKGLNLNRRNKCGETFFMERASQLTLEQMQKLEQLGANLYMVDDSGKNLLFRVDFMSKDEKRIEEYLSKKGIKRKKSWRLLTRTKDITAISVIVGIVFAIGSNYLINYYRNKSF